MLATGYTLADVARSHSAFVKADLLQGTSRTEAPGIVGGRISVNASAAVRRWGSISLRGYWPEIDPFTFELQPFRSVNDEFVPLGVFRIEDPVFEEDEDGPLTTLELYDRAHWVSALNLSTPYSVADNTLVHDAIRGLLNKVAPGLPLDFAVSDFRVPATTFEEESDPWEKCLKMAESAGMELFFDPAGLCRLRPSASVDVTSVVAEFGRTARILKIGRQIRTKDTKSHAIVLGENTALGSPVYAEAFDDDPASPTYYKGPFGDRVARLRSQFITTQSQGDAAARALLARRSGRAESVRLDTLPNAAFDAGDVASIYRPEVGADAVHVFDTLEIPLTIAGAMTATTRERRLA